MAKPVMFLHTMLPGFTGLAQIAGFRGETAGLHRMEQRVNYGLENLRRWSPLLDLNILITTLLQMMHRQGRRRFDSGQLIR